MKKQAVLLAFTFLFVLVVCGAVAAADANETLTKDLKNSTVPTITELSWDEKTFALEIINDQTGGDVTKNILVMKYVPQTPVTDYITAAAKKGTPMFVFGNGADPKVMVVAGVHGAELPPQIAAMRLLNYLQGKEIKGTLYVIPFVAPWSTERNSMYYKGMNLNTVSNVGGTPTNVVFKVAKKRSVDYFGDFHATKPTGSPAKTSILYYPRSYSMAAYINRLTGYPLINVIPYSGLLTTVCDSAGIPSVICEVLSPDGEVRSGSVEVAYKQMDAFLKYCRISITSGTSGAKSIEASCKVAKDGWSQSDTVILTRYDLFADSLSGSPLSGFYSPILLTESSKLSDKTKETILALGAKKVIILGGEKAVSNDVEAQLKQIGLSVERVGGINRYETSALIAKKLKKIGVKNVVLTTGANFPDALAAAYYAYKQNAAILLTDPKNLAEETKKTLIDMAVRQLTIIGSEVAVSQDVENELNQMGIATTRIYGNDRYETAVKLAEDTGAQNLVIITGEKFTDGMFAGAFAIKNEASIVLVKSTEIPAAVRDYLSRNKGMLNNVWIIGGEFTISAKVKAEIKKILS